MIQWDRCPIGHFNRLSNSAKTSPPNGTMQIRHIGRVFHVASSVGLSLDSPKPSASSHYMATLTRWGSARSLSLGKRPLGPFFILTIHRVLGNQ